ncbi:Formate dehydrogenase H [Natranaerofaba carboxydovora]|nr:Formate dehydrogenase H [Natranaerofaba carboxydovora]
MTNSISEIQNADAIFAIGTNTTESHPIIGQQVVKAQNKGAKVVVADPRKTPIAEMADIWLNPLPGTNVALLNGLMNVIVEEDLIDKAYINDNTENFEEVKEIVKNYTPKKVEDITGVPAEKIKEAARIYGKANKAPILYTMGITQFTTGTDGVFSVANMALMTGNVGIESGGVNPLRGQNNVQGACDLGGLPNVFTAYQKVDNPDAVEKFSKFWGAKLSDKPGKAVTEMMATAGDEIKALYIMGENPMLTDPNLGHVEKSLESLDFLVVQDILMTETAEKADVVLPAATFAEKDGTFTNTERRVQRVRKAIPEQGDSKADWKIFSELSTKMGMPMNYSSPEEIMDELREVTPSYAGISYERIEDEGIQWPCPSTDHPGTKYLHKDGKFPIGKAKFTGIEYKPAAESPDEEYPYILTTGRVLYHYHSVMTRRSKELDEEAPKGFMEIHPEDADRLSIEDEELVKVSSRRGEVKAPVKITDKISKGVVYMSFHYKEMAANKLTNELYDPKAKTPELKVSAVKIEKL